MAIKFLNSVNADSGVLYVDAINNRVGIGTTSPGSKLTVAGRVDFQNDLRLRGTDSAADQGVTRFYVDSNNKFHIDTANNGNNVFTIDSSGNVGINSTITSGYRLYVNGSTWINGGTNFQDGVSIFRTQSGAAEVMRIASNGNVGIGTTSPAEKLDVSGNAQVQGILKVTKSGENSRFNSADANGPYVSFRNNGTAKGYVGSGFHLWNSPNNLADNFGIRAENQLDFGIGASVKMTLDSSGNVGIGNTTPARKLHLNSTSTDDGIRIGVSGSYLNRPHLELEKGNTGTTWSLVAGNSGYFFIKPDRADVVTNDSDAYLTIDTSGNVGIGTTGPIAMLDVVGAQSNFVGRFSNLTSTGYAPGSIILEAGQSDSRGQGLFHYNTVADESWFTGVPYAVTSKKWIVANKPDTTFNPDVAQLSYALMTIDSNTGNVGIGTTSPSYKLDIDSGTANAAMRIASTDRYTGINFKDSFNNTNLFYDGSEDRLYTAANFRAADTQITGDFSLTTYGSGTKTGTATYALAVDSNGNIIETTVQSSPAGIDGTGTVNYLTKWSTTDTLTSSVMYDDGANIGIGTTSPDSLVEIENGPAAQSQSRMLHIDNNPAGNQGSGYIEISSGSNNQAKTQIEQVSSGGYGLLGNNYIDTNIINRGLSSSSHGNINFATGSSTSATSIVMTIGGGSQKGNVGIGTTSPAAKLVVAGTAYINQTSDYFGISNTKVQISAGSSSDNVGIRSNKLYFYSYANGSDSQLIFGDGTAHWELDANDNRFALYNHATSSTNIYVSNAGNVGIGTTSPTEKLNVAGDIGIYENGYNRKLYISNSTGSTTVQISPSGSSYFNGGNVGIGTASPTEKLHVYNQGTAMIKVDSDAVSPYKAGIEFVRSSINGGRIYNDGGAVQVKLESDFGYDSANPTRGGFLFKTAPVTSGTLVDALRIDARGYVGIGTSSPSEKLHISGNVRIEGDLTVNGSYTQIDTNTLTTEQWNVTNDGTGPAVTINQKGAQDIMDVQDDGTSVFYIEDGGNVGIGTTDPVSTLTVLGTTTSGITVQSGAASSGLKIFNNSTTDEANIINHYNGPLILGTSNSERMRIDGAGNVGIGTASPSSPLHVIGSHVSNTQTMLFTAGTSTALQLDKTDQIYMANGAALYLQHVAGSGNILMSGGGGKVGIGTTNPLEKLHVEGAIKLGQHSAVVGNGIAHHTNGYLYVTGGTSGAAIGNDSYSSAVYAVDNGSLELYAGSSNRLHITSGGNVGIGTTSPTSKLDVAGAVQVRYSNDHTTGDISVNKSALDLYNPLEADTDEKGSIITFSDNYQDAGGFNKTTRAAIKGGTDTTGNTANGFLAFYTDSSGSNSATERMRINYAGNVGIGTNNPGNKLHIVTSGESSPVKLYQAQYQQFQFNYTDTYQSSLDFGHFGRLMYEGNGGYLILSNRSSQTGSHIRLETSDTERLRITHDGKVGIGTTSPGSQLEVATNASFGATIGVTGAGDSGTNAPAAEIQFRSSDQAARFYGYDRSTSAYTNLSIGNDHIYIPATGGNVGIGTTSPIAKLDVAGDTRSTNFQVNSGGRYKIGNLSQYITGYNDTAIDIVTGGTISLRVADSGNVGIGITSPTRKLDVSGATRIGGKTIYTKSYGSLDTTGQAVAGLASAGNGGSARFVFEMHGGAGSYQRIVYSCYNTSGTWNIKKQVDEGNNAFDVTATTSDSGATYVFTFKGRTANQSYSPMVTVEHVGYELDTSYL